MTLIDSVDRAHAEQSGSAIGFSRRRFLRAAAAAGGGLVLSLQLPFAGRGAARPGLAASFPTHSSVSEPMGRLS
jgi:hypothetical protein